MNYLLYNGPFVNLEMIRVRIQKDNVTVREFSDEPEREKTEFDVENIDFLKQNVDI